MKPRVLIVDDSITVRMDLRAVLSMAGFVVTTCSTQGAALAALKVQPFELAILDILLPDGSGIDLLKEIKQTPELRSIRVFMLSTEAEVRSRILGLRLGAELYVGKPYDRGYVARMARELFKMADGFLPAASLRSLCNRKILVVDDSPTFREAVAIALQKGGNQVVQAACGEDALALAAVERFDAIFLDLVMPGLGGIETCRRLRTLRDAEHVPLALMTASIEAHKEAEAAAAGADELLLKPANLGQILERLRSLLLKKQRMSAPGVEPSGAERGARRESENPPGAPRTSLLYRQVVAACGLSELMARSVIDRALLRVGSSAETLMPEHLQHALPHIGGVLRIFLPHGQASQRIDELTALAGPAVPPKPAGPTLHPSTG